MATTEHAHEHDEVFDPAAHRPSRRTLAVSLGVGGVIAAILVAVGVVPRLAHRNTIRDDHERAQTEVARVLVVHPVKSGAGGGVSLPSTVEPLRETIVYARTNGYVHKWSVDIGDSVKEGQVLATIDTPEVDQELRQAQASLNQSKAQAEQARTQRELARTTKARYGALQPSGYVSTQDFEDKSASFDAQRANVSAAEANVASAEANVKKYQELKSFSVVTAPFEGVVTSRTTENGQLVNAGSNAGQALFKVAKIDVMRMFINVPQSYAPSVKIGQTAHVSVREFPGRAFTGTVERTARELDAATRTLLTEVRIKNDDGALISGMYAQVQLDMRRTEEPLLVPATALSVTAQGTRMAIVQNGVIAWKVVRVENDLGDKIAISGGLAPTDDVVVLPGEKLVEGLKVSAEEQPQR